MDRRKKSKGNRSSQNSVRINISNRQKDLAISRLSVKKALEALVDFLDLTCNELSCFLVSKKKISQLHKRFFQDPTPTDCISLPLDTDYLGDIFVCPAVALEYAAKKRLNAYDETLLYLIHSLLHLIGYDDLDSKKRSVMRKKEKKCMEYLRSQQINLRPE